MCTATDEAFSKHFRKQITKTFLGNISNFFKCFKFFVILKDELCNWEHFVPFRGLSKWLTRGN